MNTPVRLPAVGLLLALLLALALPGSGVAATRQIALGVSMANSWDLSQLDSFTANVRKPAVWALWSDWGGPELSEAQSEYAGSDVSYLQRMASIFEKRLEREWSTAKAWLHREMKSSGDENL